MSIFITEVLTTVMKMDIILIKTLAILRAWPKTYHVRFPLQWRLYERDGVSNHQRIDFYSTVCSDAGQRNHQSSASLTFVRSPVNCPRKGPVTRKMFPFDDVNICMWSGNVSSYLQTNDTNRQTPRDARGSGVVRLRLMASQYHNFVYHKEKQKSVKCICCDVWAQNFVWNSKGALWNFTHNFEPVHRKICISRCVKIYQFMIS